MTFVSAAWTDRFQKEFIKSWNQNSEIHCSCTTRSDTQFWHILLWLCVCVCVCVRARAGFSDKSSQRQSGVRHLWTRQSYTARQQRGTVFLSSGVQGQQTIFAPLHILSHNNHARGLWVICVDQSQKFGFWATMFNRTKYLTLAGPVEVTNCHWAVPWNARRSFSYPCVYGVRSLANFWK